MLFSFLFLTFSCLLIVLSFLFLRSAYPTWKWIDIALASLTPGVLSLSAGLLLSKSLEMATNGYWQASRLMPSFALNKGISLFQDPSTDAVFSWMYGPLSVFAYLPVAMIASSPRLALILASLLSAAFVFLPILWLCLQKAQHLFDRLLGLLVFACAVCYSTINPSLNSLSFLVVDAPAMGLAAISLLTLDVRGHSSSKQNRYNLILFLSAMAGVWAIFTKQVLLPLPLVLLLYLGLVDGFFAARRYAVFLIFSGVLTTALLSRWFSWKALIFFLLLPRRYGLQTIPYDPDIAIPVNSLSRLLSTLFHSFYELLSLSIFPLAVLIFFAIPLVLPDSEEPVKAEKQPLWVSFQNWLRLNAYSLPLLLALVMLPVCVLSRIKIGGALNSQVFTVYFLILSAITITLDRYRDALLNASLSHHRRLLLPREVIQLLVVLVTISTCFSFPIVQSVAKIDALHQKTINSPAQVAYRYLKLHPDVRIYFPEWQLSTLMAKGEFYHHEAGINDRLLAGMSIPDTLIRAHIPANTQYIAKVDASLLPVIAQHLPEFNRRVTIPDLPGWVVLEKTS